MGADTTHRYVYSLTAYHVDEVFDRLARAGQPADGPRVLYCDTEGTCIFDEQDESYLDALAAILNAEAAGGKRLKQLIFREAQMIAIWEEKHKQHAACPVPAGIIKAIEVAAGLALPKDAKIEVSSE